jgi:hypothetical protein
MPNEDFYLTICECICMKACLAQNIDMVQGGAVIRYGKSDKAQ